jgi:protein-tyrosine kinase
MGRIEDALAKLQAQGKPPAPSRPQLGRVVDVPSNAVARPYGGKIIEVATNELRAQGLLAPDVHERRLANQYRTIKRPLLQNANPNRDPSVRYGNLLLVASALAGEGKTFTCLNLCLSLAREQDWEVVLVDGDCSKPHLTRLFGAQGEPGLLDLLKGPERTFESLVMPTNIPGFSLLPAGTRDERTATELFGSARMESLCAELSASNPKRLVVFDSAPLLLTPESPVLATQVGQVVLVVRANRTPQQLVLRARDKLDPAKAVNLILNQADPDDELGSYAGYYGYDD